MIYNLYSNAWLKNRIGTVETSLDGGITCINMDGTLNHKDIGSYVIDVEYCPSESQTKVISCFYLTELET